MLLRSNVNFTGYNIVPDNVENHREKFGDKFWRFEVHDLVSEAVNQQFDIVLSRHTTMHLRYYDVITIIKLTSLKGGTKI